MPFSTSCGTEVSEGAEKKERRTASRRPAIIIVLVLCGLLACSCGGTSPQRSRTPTPEPVTAWLYCPDCKAEGMQINLWQNCSSNRGSVVGKANHADEVFVLSKTRDSSEGRDYYKVRVKSTDATGCVPETLIAVP